MKRLHKADIPGGFSLDFTEGLQKAQTLSEVVEAEPKLAEKRSASTLPLTEANARMIELGLRPSPSGLDMSYYAEIARQDPNLSLAGLRIEVDILIRNLMRGFGLDAAGLHSSQELVTRLYGAEAITYEQMALTLEVLRLCSAAVHGQLVTKRQAEEVIELAEVLAEDYIAWLDWGFDNDWKSKR